MWLSKFEHSTRELTAECHGPQSCLPVSRGISFVDGKENFRVAREEEICWEREECEEEEMWLDSDEGENCGLSGKGKVG